MIKITNLTAKNFLSIGNVTQAVKLDSNGLTLVLGSNTDANGGTTRNGAGKTTILQAISFGLYGLPLTQIKKDNLINNINGKGMLVTIDFERDGKKYRIERGRKPNILKFYVAGVEQKGADEDESQGENKHTQEEILRVIGMTHTMFKHIVALNTFTDPFLRMKVSDQREVIEELLGITQISQRAETLKKLIGQTKENIRDMEAAVKATAEANSRIEAAIRNTQSQSDAWQRNHANAVTTLTEEIETMKNVDFDAEIAVFDAINDWDTRAGSLQAQIELHDRDIAYWTREIDKHNSDISKLRNERSETGSLTRLGTEITRKERDAKRHRSQAIAFQAELVSAENDLANSDSQICVCCGQKLEGTEHLATVTANLKSKIADLKEKIGREDKEASDREAEIASIRLEIEQIEKAAAKRQAEKEKDIEAYAQAIATFQINLDEKLEAKVRDMTELKAIGERPVSMFRNIDEVYRTKQMFDTLVRDLEQEIAKENPHANQIENLKATLQEIDYDPLNEQNMLLKHQDFLLKLLTSKDSFIRKKIIDQNLAYLNTRLNHYLDKLGLPHEVRFMSDLSVEISLLGRDFDFEQLSRGEMNRVIMATSWSFRDVWESMNTSINLLWVDEMLDQGTDSQGVEAALAILKNFARNKKNVFLISHRDELVGRIDQILLVKKDNGFTVFENDASL